MKRRAVRVTVVLVLVACAAAAAHQAVTRSASIAAADGRLTAISDAAARADLAFTDIAASQRAYVAPGQGLDFWAGRVDESLASARAALTTLRGAATGAVAQVDSAISRLDDFAVMDRRVRDYIRDDRRSMASDLIFADGYEIVSAARGELFSAVLFERAAAAAPLARDRQLHLASVSALAACALLASLLLLRAPKPEHPPVVSTIKDAEVTWPAHANASIADDSIGAALDASLESLDTPTLRTRPTSTATTKAPRIDVPTSVDLASAADVCVDLSRLLDERDLQAMLGRVAEALSADGLVVWLADQGGQTLEPALTHGYAPALVARMGTLSVEEDNATASAWRARSTQVVNGALAVPLLTAEGCTGVLAVELRDGKERASDVQSLARIVAAQLAATVSASSSEVRKAAEA